MAVEVGKRQVWKAYWKSLENSGKVGKWRNKFGNRWLELENHWKVGKLLRNLFGKINIRNLTGEFQETVDGVGKLRKKRVKIAQFLQKEFRLFFAK